MKICVTTGCRKQLAVTCYHIELQLCCVERVLQHSAFNITSEAAMTYTSLQGLALF